MIPYTIQAVSFSVVANIVGYSLATNCGTNKYTGTGLKLREVFCWETANTITISSIIVGLGGDLLRVLSQANQAATKEVSTAMAEKEAEDDTPSYTALPYPAEEQSCSGEDSCVQNPCDAA